MDVFDIAFQSGAPLRKRTDSFRQWRPWLKDWSLQSIACMVNCAIEPSLLILVKYGHGRRIGSKERAEGISQSEL